jgi:hypothetical protein
MLCKSAALTLAVRTFSASASVKKANAGPFPLIVDGFIYYISDGTMTKRCRLNEWTDVGVGDIKIFMAYQILMGLMKKPRLATYWSTDPYIRTPIFNKFMTRNRFEGILSNLHLADETQPPQGDGLYRIRPFLTLLNENFKDVYTPAREVALDEGGCPFKGRCKFKKYCPKKPNKWSIKMYQVCESRTGYTLQFYIEDGTKYNWDNVKAGESGGKTLKVVMNLMRDANCLDKGHRCYMDNYYNSVHLAEELLKYKTACCGTLATGRQGAPLQHKGITRKGKPFLEKHKGKVWWRRNGDILVSMWFDKRAVSTISTCNEAKMVLAKVDYKGRRIMKPEVVCQYSQNMYGVDLSDQKASYYTPLKRTVKWWRKLFFHLLNLAVINAHVMYMSAAEASVAQVKPPTLDHFTFRMKLVKQLLCAGVATAKCLPNRMVCIQASRFLAPGLHYPRYNERHPQATSSKRHPARRCVHCKENNRRRESIYHCGECHVVLCVVPCFEEHHAPSHLKGRERSSPVQVGNWRIEETDLADEDLMEDPGSRRRSPVSATGNAMPLDLMRVISSTSSTTSTDRSLSGSPCASPLPNEEPCSSDSNAATPTPKRKNCSLGPATPDAEDDLGNIVLSTPVFKKKKTSLGSALLGGLVPESPSPQKSLARLKTPVQTIVAVERSFTDQLNSASKGMHQLGVGNLNPSVPTQDLPTEASMSTDDEHNFQARQQQMASAGKGQEQYPYEFDAETPNSLCLQLTDVDDDSDEEVTFNIRKPTSDSAEYSTSRPQCAKSLWPNSAENDDDEKILTNLDLSNLSNVGGNISWASDMADNSLLNDTMQAVIIQDICTDSFEETTPKRIVSEIVQKHNPENS